MKRVRAVVTVALEYSTAGPPSSEGISDVVRASLERHSCQVNEITVERWLAVPLESVPVLDLDL